MKNKAQPIIIGTLLLICIVFLGLAVFAILYLIPQNVASYFGPPADHLDFAQGLIYSMRLFFAMEEFKQASTQIETNEIFLISEGESATSITERLERSNYIPDATSFTHFLIYSGIDRRIQPGAYQVTPGMQPIDLAEMLQDPNPEDVTFSFLPGWRWEEIVNLLPFSGLHVTEEEFESAMHNAVVQFQTESENAIAGAEGFLYPDAYTLPRSATADEMVQLFVSNFFSKVPLDFSERAAVQGLTEYEAVILASIVQKEMVNAEEAPLLTSVFLNRLRADMPLQSDPTVQYAIGFQTDQNTWWKSPLSEKDLQIASPFNTYLTKGLPPAPICSPGLEALQAVLQPAETRFYYFRASCEGTGAHVFSETYTEHLEHQCAQ